MSKHTPGPWNVERCTDEWFRETNHGERIVSVNKATYFVAAVEGYGEESVANARLIAAAPDLLAALQNIMQDASEGGRKGRALDLLPRSSIEAARAAIAKATEEKQ